MSDTTDRDSLTGRRTTGHERDGIRELNTPLPKWWLCTFYATIVFAIGYCVFFPALPGFRGHTTGVLEYTSRKALDQELASAAEAQSGMRQKVAAASLDDIQRDPELRAWLRMASFAAPAAPPRIKSSRASDLTSTKTAASRP